MVVKQTRKGKDNKNKEEKAMTIPQLRKAFTHIESFVHKTDYDIEAFRKEWKKVFGKAVTEENARDYLEFMKGTEKPMQQGGSAPIDYTLRPGIAGPYGNFPPYVANGFGFANHDSFRLGCGYEDISPRVPASLGSNLVTAGGGSIKKRGKTRKQKKQKGGALFPPLSAALQEFGSRPFGMNSPPNAGQAFQHTIKGGEPLNTSDPSQNSLRHVPQMQSKIYDASVTF